MIQKCLSCRNLFESDGHTNCNSCRENQRRWYLRNKEHRSKYAHEWYLENQDITKERTSNRYYSKNDEVKAYRIAKRDTTCESGKRVCPRCLKTFERDESDKRHLCDYCLEFHRKNDAPYREIWEQHFRVKIPDGFVIHHKDGDRDNNIPHNLLCLPISEHSRLHWIKGDIRKKVEG